MGLLDRVKEQAATAATAAKDAAQKGQAKLDAVQAKRAADAILRDLGAVVYGQKTGRSGANAPGDIDRLTEALQQHEAAHGPVALGLESPAVATSEGSASPPPAAGAPPPPPPAGQSV